MKYLIILFFVFGPLVVLACNTGQTEGNDQECRQPSVAYVVTESHGDDGDVRRTICVGEGETVPENAARVQ